MGDSISAAYGIDVNKGWVSLLQNKITENHYPHIVYNESISGDTSAGGLSRIGQALEKHQPRFLLLELGANDGLRGVPPSVMKNNLRAIIQRAQASHCQVLLLSMRIPSNYGKRFTEMFYATYFDLAKELNIPVVPFILDGIALDETLMQKDRLHPNEQAQALIMAHIWPYLQPLLEQEKASLE